MVHDSPDIGFPKPKWRFQLPKEWTEAYIISIFKRGDRRKCENYSGINILLLMGRLLGKC